MQWGLLHDKEFPRQTKSVNELINTRTALQEMLKETLLHEKKTKYTKI